MEAYRREIKKRMKFLGMMTIVSVVIIAGSFLIHLRVDENSHLLERMLGFQTGLFAAFLVSILMILNSYRKILKDDETCRKEYIKENDERLKKVREWGITTGYWVSLFVLIVSTLISGYFNGTVFYTLATVLFVFCIITAVCKFIGNSKM